MSFDEPYLMFERHKMDGSLEECYKCIFNSLDRSIIIITILKRWKNHTTTFNGSFPREVFDFQIDNDLNGEKISLDSVEPFRLVNFSRENPPSRSHFRRKLI